jgi:hypothetical protein
VQNATREIASFIGRAPKHNTSGDEAGFILTPNSPSMATFHCELLISSKPEHNSWTRR